MALMVRKVFEYGVIGLLTLLLVAATAARADKGNPRATGLREPTAADLDYVKRNWQKIRKVRPNAVGLQRINKARLNKGKLELGDEFLAPAGEDVIGALEGTEPAAGTETLNGELPGAVDNSTLAAFPPIRTQGSLGSCVPFSINYYQLTHNLGLILGWNNKSTDNTTKFSPKWSYNMINGGANNGAYFTDAYRILELHGCATWDQVPYDSNYLEWCLEPAVWRAAISYRTESVQYVSSVNTDAGLDQLKSLLNNGYVSIFGTYIHSWQVTSAGDDPATAADDGLAGDRIVYWMNGTEGGHSMTFVGYNDTVWVDVNGNGVVDSGEKGALRVANSWGDRWEDGGFIWMAYDALRDVSAVSGGPSSGRIGTLQSDRAYHLPVRADYAPQVLAEFTINHGSRNELRMNLGVSDTSRTTPSVNWFPGAIYYDGGPFAFDGSAAAVNGTFVFDFTDIVPEGNGLRWYVGMYDSASGDPAALYDFTLIDVANGDILVQSAAVPQTADGGEQTYAWVDYDFFDGNMPPEAEFSATPTFGDIPLTVYFDASASLDPDGSIAAYDWDFGDGSTGSGMTPDHTYSAAGDFTVSLTVTDDMGKMDTAAASITATDPSFIESPLNLAASAAGAEVTLTWTDRSINEDGFSVERAEKVRGKYRYEEVGQVAANVTTFIEFLPAGTYKYRVRGFNASLGTFSDYSGELLVKVEEEANVPPDPGGFLPPGNLEATLSGSEVSLTWQDNSSDEDGFYVERGTKVTGKVTFSYLGETGANVTSFSYYTDTGTWYYRVQAFKSGETSDYSNIVTVRAK